MSNKVGHLCKTYEFYVVFDIFLFVYIPTVTVPHLNVHVMLIFTVFVKNKIKKTLYYCICNYVLI